MNSSTLQFLIAGALIVAWGWMLGRPILTNLFRRSRRDSVGHFRYQQAVLGRPLEDDPFFSRRSVVQTAIQPFRDWRAQPRERRRLQVMLGFGFATFFSLLMAIALRGSAVRLFLIMLACFAVYLGYAAAVGSAQLRREERALSDAAGRATARGGQQRQAVADQPEDAGQAEDAGQRRDRSARRRGDRVIAPMAGRDLEQDVDGEEWEDDDHLDQRYAVAEVEAESDDPFDEYDGFGTGEFTDDFFEPIPELQFAPLNLDASLISPAEEDLEPVAVEAGAVADGEIDIDGAVHTDRDPVVEEPAAVETAPDGATAEALEQTAAEEPPAREVAPETPDAPGETAEEPAGSGPSFTAPPRQRQRPKRTKARPIYIESQLDEADDQQRVVND